MQSSTVGPIDDTISEEYPVVHHLTPATGSTTGTSASASADVNITSDKDDNLNTQSDANDASNDSSDGIDAEIETMNREMERYVSRSPPYNPAAGNQVRKPPHSQGPATNIAYRSSGAPKGRPPAVTANAGTTAQPKRK